MMRCCAHSKPLPSSTRQRTSSLPRPQRTVTRAGEPTEIVTKGRHDPCVGIRAVPIGEAMVACVIADHYLRHRGQVGAPPQWPFARAQR